MLMMTGAFVTLCRGVALRDLGSCFTSRPLAQLDAGAGGPMLRVDGWSSGTGL